MLLKLIECGNHTVSDMAWSNILATYLDDAGGFTAGSSEESAKVQIMCENSVAVISCPFHDFAVWRSRVTDINPMDCFQPFFSNTATHKGERFMSINNFIQLRQGELQFLQHAMLHM